MTKRMIAKLRSGTQQVRYVTHLPPAVANSQPRANASPSHSVPTKSTSANPAPRLSRFFFR